MPSHRAVAVKSGALALGPEQSFATDPPSAPFKAAAPTMPARELQALLGAHLAEDESFGASERRWSPRRMIVVAVAASGLLWGAIGIGAYLLIRGL